MGWIRRMTRALCIAAKRGDLQTMRDLLDAGADARAKAFLGKAQDHGYFLLRIPPQDSCALYLVRDYLMNKEDERHGGKAKARTASLILMALGQGGGRPSDERARLNDSDEAEFDPA